MKCVHAYIQHAWFPVLIVAVAEIFLYTSLQRWRSAKVQCHVTAFNVKGNYVETFANNKQIANMVTTKSNFLCNAICNIKRATY